MTWIWTFVILKVSNRAKTMCFKSNKLKNWGKFAETASSSMSTQRAPPFHGTVHCTFTIRAQTGKNGSWTVKCTLQMLRVINEQPSPLLGLRHAPPDVSTYSHPEETRPYLLRIAWAWRRWVSFPPFHCVKTAQRLLIAQSILWGCVSVLIPRMSR